MTYTSSSGGAFNDVVSTYLVASVVSPSLRPTLSPLPSARSTPPSSDCSFRHRTRDPCVHSRRLYYTVCTVSRPIDRPTDGPHTAFVQRRPTTTDDARDGQLLSGDAWSARRRGSVCLVDKQDTAARVAAPRTRRAVYAHARASEHPSRQQLETRLLDRRRRGGVGIRKPSPSADQSIGRKDCITRVR